MQGNTIDFEFHKEKGVWYTRLMIIQTIYLQYAINIYLL